MPKVSILMNCYNCERYVKEAIDSVYAQTYQDWEIVFVNNCSTDQSAQIAASYDDRIRIVKTDELIPLGHARNFGLKHCHGEYLAFLDTDDAWLPQKLETQMTFMEEHGYFMSYCGFMNMNEAGDVTKTNLPRNVSGNIFPSLLKRNEINMQTAVIKNQNVSFREDLAFSPDYNLFLKTSMDHEIGVIEEPMVKYRVHQNSLSGKTMQRWGVEKAMTLDEVFTLRPDLKEKYPKEARLAYAYAGQLKAKYYMHAGKRLEAIKELYRHKFVKPSYFVFFLLSLMPKFVWDRAHSALRSR